MRWDGTDVYCNSEDRIRKSCEKLTKNVKAATQSRMSDFFKSVPAKPSPASGNALKKRKEAPEVSFTKVIRRLPFLSFHLGERQAKEQTQEISSFSLNDGHMFYAV